ncbi:multifunctional CCA addition/repair protein [Aliikangiella marina]|uniref:Multifunctional CCA protein n=1 Tax=Aliikangiella marina TaxID=1712262 RepID=A0A545TCC5_9GAMM|nr:multifunctional CCA addition/repair protein [Aliikangiella marina]TQV74873.1 multifunctional CCA addition/repair protein [Aliikangiella marina]
MQIFLVGGAVRDKLLNFPVVEYDWVVVGAAPDEMLERGFKQVGKDFPVFLHPESGDEYALARTERKSGKGYYGFEVFADKDVTLEDDLVRRDLTINAIAMTDDGELIDPYNGQADIESKVLRHISPAFAEDPLRVLRVARFAARYAHLGFTIAPETLELMKKLCQTGELNHLSAERVWKETYRAIGENSPQVYFEVLKACGGLQYWFAELDVLWGIPNPPKWHPEIDTGIHTMMVLEQAAKLSTNPVVRFAAVCHDLGKGITPTDQYPAHRGHEKHGIPLVKRLCTRLKAPTEYLQLSLIACEYHLHMHRIEELKAATIVKLLEKTDAFRKPERFQQYVQVCEADFRGRTGFENKAYPQREIMLSALAACADINPKTFVDKGLVGKQIGEAIHQERVNRVKQII